MYACNYLIDLVLNRVLETSIEIRVLLSTVVVKNSFTAWNLELGVNFVLMVLYHHEFCSFSSRSC
jgi:hypothetical protein